MNAERLIDQYVGACHACGAEPGCTIDCTECMSQWEAQDEKGYPGSGDFLSYNDDAAKEIDALANGSPIKNDKIDRPTIDPGASKTPGEYQLRSLITTMSGAKPI